MGSDRYALAVAAKVFGAEFARNAPQNAFDDYAGLVREQANKIINAVRPDIWREDANLYIKTGACRKIINATEQLAKYATVRPVDESELRRLRRFETEHGSLTHDDIQVGVTAVMADGQTYKDVTVAVDQALERTLTELETVGYKRASYEIYEFPFMILDRLLSIDKEITWFYDYVKPDGDWDIKAEESWNTTIGSTYPGSYNSSVVYRGQVMTLEQLGNYTYGYIGAAAGFSLEVLNTGSWYAAGFPISGSDLVNEVGDREDIKKGFEAYRYRFMR